MGHLTEQTLLRIATAGSVDDGKSTLIGRLLHDTGNVYEDHLEALKKTSSRMGEEHLALALLTDGLKAEREQGITIDVAYRYFSTPQRRFILADTPGHEQYTRNMATGASTADVSIILVDARNGVLTQTKRHAFIAALMGVPRLLVTVNKMDLVGYSQEVFETIRQDFVAFAEKLEIRDIRFVPVAALHGDNVVTASANMPWYKGETVLEYLNNVYTGSDRNMVDFRFPVQYVVRAGDYRGYAGQLASGLVKRGDEIVVLPALRKTRIKAIHQVAADGQLLSLEEAFAPMPVTLLLDEQIDVSRGDMLCRPQNLPAVRSHFEAMVVWLTEKALDSSKPYILRHTTREARVLVDRVAYRVDVNTLSRCKPAPLALNEVGRLAFRATSLLCLDTYRANRTTGNFVLIDPEDFQTVGAGMVIERLPEETLEQREKQLPKSAIHSEPGLITPAERQNKTRAEACTFWLTGLSGSGKSTIAKFLEKRLFDLDIPVFRIDGDTLRTGLNSDLGFSKTDRAENIRRAAEVAKLFNEAGISVICSFISPYERDRSHAKDIIGADRYVQVFVDTPLDVCRARDPHGLYRRALAGEIKDFTGISAPYEPPAKSDLIASTVAMSAEECVERLLTIFKARFLRN